MQRVGMIPGVAVGRAEGTLGGLITAAHLAVIDRRDLSVWAFDIRSHAGASPK